MTLTPVKSLPKKMNHAYNDVQAVIDEFMDSDTTIARVDCSNCEYASSAALYTSFIKAVKYSNRPVKVRMRNYQVYLIKK